MDRPTTWIHRSRPDRAAIGLLTAWLLLAGAGVRPASAAPRPVGAALGFEENRGQLATEACFATRGRDFALALETDRARLHTRVDSRPAEPGASIWSIEMRFSGARKGVAPHGESRLEGHLNYQRGADPAKWILGVSRFARVRYPALYPGVDALYHGDADEVELDFVVAPGADPEPIRVAFGGVDALEVDDRGRLVLRRGGDVFVLKAPVAYQRAEADADRRQSVPVRYRVAGTREVAFELGRFDAGRPLVIDPVLAGASIRVGGSLDERVRDVAVGSDGRVFVSGVTDSNDLLGAALPSGFGGGDAFVAAFREGGQGLVYATYLGGDGFDSADGITAGAAGEAFVVGETMSTDFPAVNGAWVDERGGQDAFVARLDPAGVVTYGSYYGTADDDGFAGAGVTEVPGGIVYITSRTTNGNALPTKDAFQPTCVSAQCGFVAGFDPDASGMASFVYGTYLSGNQDTATHRIESDGAGRLYVHGHTSASAGLVDPAQGFDTTYDAMRDHFLVVLDPSLAGAAQRVYSTYMGGDGDELEVGDLVVDDSGLVWIAGVTDSTAATFPLQAPLQADNAGAEDFYVAAIDTTMTGAGSLLWSTFLGGSSGESFDLIGLAVDSLGNVSVAGESTSFDYPLLGQLPDFPRPGLGGVAGVVTTLDPTGQSLLVSTGVPGADALAVDAHDRLYVAGDAAAVFPLEGQVPFGPTGGRDVFLGRLDPVAAGLALEVERSHGVAAPGDVVAMTLRVRNHGPADASDVTVEIPVAGLTFDTLPAPCWIDGPNVRCEFFDLPSGRSVTIAPRLVAPSTGPLAFAAQVTSSTPDPEPADDAVAASVKVDPAAGLSPAPLKLADFDVVAAAYDIGAFALDTRTGILATSNGSFDDAMNFMVFEGSLPVFAVSGPESGGTLAFGFVERADWTPSVGDGTHLAEPYGNPSHRVFASLDEQGTLRLHSAAAWSEGVVVAEVPVGVVEHRGFELAVDPVGLAATVTYDGQVVLQANPFVGWPAADPAQVGDDFVVTVGLGDEFLGQAVFSDAPPKRNNCGLGSELVVLLPLLAAARRWGRRRGRAA